MCHFLGLHPDTEAVRIAQQLHIAYSLNTFDLRDDVNIQIVGQKVLVVASVRTDEAVDLQVTVLSFHGAYTDGRYFGR